MVSPARRNGLVLFANSSNGLSIVQPMLEDLGMPRVAPALAWLDISPLSLAWGLFVRSLAARRASAALDDYKAYRSGHPGERPIGEEVMYQAGYALLRAGKAKDGIALFRQNVEDHPDSWNVHDSLGEGLAAGGDKEGANKKSERSLQLSPENAGGKEALKKLRGQRP